MSARRVCCCICPGFEGTALTGPKSKREPCRPLWGLAPPEAGLERCSAPSVRSGPVSLHPLVWSRHWPEFQFCSLSVTDQGRWVQLSDFRLFGPGGFGSPGAAGSVSQVFACLDQVGQALRSSPVLDQAGRTYLDLLLTGRPGLSVLGLLLTRLVGISVFDLFQPRRVEISILGL